MKILGCDLHAKQQTIAMVDTETGEFTEKTLNHTGSLRESDDLASMVCVQPNGSARFHFISLVALPTRHLSGHLRS
jgi:hypothetical protein